MASTDGEAPSRHHPSALRNRGFIAAELGKWLGGSTQDAPHLLEVASGTGCHVEAFAGHLPAFWTYQPTEYDQTRIPDILATIEEGKHSNIRPPVVLDVCSDPSTWPRPAGGETAEGASRRQWDAIVCSNMIHISPQECTGGLLGGAAAGLKVGGHLFIYGPFALNGLLIPDSNKNFDTSLKARSGGSWGIRDAAWVCGLAHDQGLELTAMTLMPANNFFVVFKKVREVAAAAAADVEDRKARVAELVAAVVMPAREALVTKVSAK
ncbi:conserved unknown protein [Ectocarpus siliculosus]|uniref:DUF938 domain-containing protein n=1 Tax=Ectocarpus siliculosus TaxID=2880 RepID=D7FQQ8_ECTSI|nr:conserved unknown protein [Ectocarpus siliculosus]|eukprot:CBJ49165.1 conserved unknown protein [Ectocarpus siliculosus]